MSSLSKEKARRLQNQGSRRWVYIVVILAVASVVSIGIAYGLVDRGNPARTTTTTSFTLSSYTASTGPEGTTVTLVCSPSSQMVEANSSCTATISDVRGLWQGAAPTGAVTISGPAAGELRPATCNTSGGSLICTTEYAPAFGSEGPNLLTATYHGDHAHAGSSGTFSLQATKRPTSVTISCSPLEVPVNSKEACAAGVSDSGAGTPSNPNGTVGFAPIDSGTFIPSGCTLSQGSCSVSFMPSPGKEGVISISAAYGGDADHGPSSGSKPDAFAAVRRSSGSTVTCSPSQLSSGGVSTCTAFVSDTTSSAVAIAPTGKFTFATGTNGGSFSPVTCTLAGHSNTTSTCSTQYNPAPGNSGNQLVGGRYGGDGDHTASTSSPFTITLKARASTTVVSCSTASAQEGVKFSCGASVFDSSSGATSTPVGKVIFSTNSSGAFNPSACYLSATICSVSYTSESGGEGTAMITGSYSGDANHTASSAAFLVKITPRPTTMALQCSPPSVPVGVSTFCSVEVSDQGASTGISVPTGTVQFSASGGVFSQGGTCQLTAGGCSISFTPSPGSEGSIEISSSYRGDVDHSQSTATPFNIVSKQRAVTVTVSCAPSSILGGQNTTCTATVTDSDPGVSIEPTGTVTFTDNYGGNFTSTSCDLSSGSCSVVYTAPLVLTQGTITITATYVGDLDHGGGSKSTTVLVSP